MTTENLFAELDAAFEKSDIKRIAENNKCVWNYSLTSTPIHENGLLLIGFNPGAKKDYPYEKQDKLPDKDFPPEDLGSFKRIIPFLKTFCPDQPLNKIVQINYCFFRSSKEIEISENDKALCTPIFLKLISFIKPKQVISFSVSLRHHLLNNNLFQEIYNSPIASNRGTINASVGKLNVNSKKIPIGFLPHPNYPLIRHAREQAWKVVIEKLNTYE